MTAHCFSIPVLNPEPALAEFNAFCRVHRVLATERQLVQAGTTFEARAPDAFRAVASLRGGAS